MFYFCLREGGGMEARMGDGGMKGGMEACREGWGMGNGERGTGDGKGRWL